MNKILKYDKGCKSDYKKNSNAKLILCVLIFSTRKKHYLKVKK